MEQLSIQDLKATLSAAVARAEAGDTIVITRHNEPVAKLVPARPHRVHQGKGVARPGLRPGLRRGPRIRYLDILSDDRGDR